MKKIISSGLAAGSILLVLSEIGLRLTVLLFPDLAVEYFDSAFSTEENSNILFYMHPFIISMALSWFWTRFKGVLTGSLLTRGVEFGVIYAMVATFPMMWLIYSTMNVSLAIVSTWFILAILQGIISGLVFERMNP
ncbi:hypothetical protein CNR22_02055 [Sphingobacteriaceae bacterium]|nr:hypothetical protein CNR22_02055 [Sphingobacteriaceae bacterium]